MDKETIRLRFPISTGKKVATVVVATIGFILTWTGWTGPQLLTTVASVSWLGFFGSDWFRTVLVVLGLLAVVGVLVYWFRATPATMETVTVGIPSTVAGEPTRPKNDAQGPTSAPVQPRPSAPGVGLRALLQEELRQGEMLRQGATHGDSMMAAAMGVRSPTDDDISMWEDRVHGLLLANDYQWKAARFLSDPPDDTLRLLKAGLFPNPRHEQLVYRLAQLEKIIQELPGA